MRKKTRDIDCPLCHQFLVRTTISRYVVHQIRCKRCNKLICYDPESFNLDFVVKDVPARASSDGKRFY